MSSLYLFLFVLAFDSVFSIEPRVFGAEDMRFDVHKYLVKLKIHHFNSLPALCSGSIIGSNWLITSAHCFRGDEKYVAVYHQYEEGSRIIAKVDRQHIFPHPDWIVGNFSMTNRSFDIALLKCTNITFSKHVQSIKLSKTSPKRGQSGIIAGFGESETDVEPPREGFVTVNWCPFGVPGLLCSENTVRAGAGDSGGSLTSNGRLIGVTSASCKNVEEPKVCITIYVSVIANMKWLREILLQ